MRPGWRWALLTIASVLSAAVLRPSAQTPARARPRPPRPPVSISRAWRASTTSSTRPSPRRSCPAPWWWSGAATVVCARRTAIARWSRRRADDARHHLRPRLAHQGRGDDDRRDDAGRGRDDPADGPGRVLHSWVRQLRQGRHHRPPPADAHVRACGPTSIWRSTWAGYDEAIALAVEEVPTSPPGERFVYSDINFFLLGEIVARVQQAAARRVRARSHLRAARHARHDVQAAGVAACRASRRPRSARRSAGRATGRARDAARRRARSDGAPHGRRRRPRRACSARPRTSRSSAGCCSAAARSGARACCRR